MSKKPTPDTLRDVVREALRDMLREELSDLVGNPDARLRNHDLEMERDEDGDRDDDSNRVDRPTRRRNRKTRGLRRGPRVAYVVVKSKRTKKAPALDLPAGNVEDVYEWLTKQRTPATAKEIERGTGLKKKAVESAVYALRTIGVVESQPIENGD